MPVNVFCKYNDQGAWCKNKNIKRSLFGIGVRCCVNFPYPSNKGCQFQIDPSGPPPILYPEVNGNREGKTQGGCARGNPNTKPPIELRPSESPPK